MENRVFPAKTEALPRVLDFSESILSEAGFPMKSIIAIQIALEEMFVNVAHYAYGDSEGDCEIGISVEDGTAVIRISDRGMRFDPLQRPDPDTTLSAEEREIGGLGIYMVKRTMDEVGYEYKDNKNIFTMKKGKEKK